MTNAISCRGILALFFIFAWTATSANAQGQQPKHIVLPYYLEHIERPTPVWTDFRVAVRSCLDNSVCGGMIAAGETALGIPPGSTATTVTALDSYGLGPQVNRDGFSRYYWYEAPPGYSYCALTAFVTSGGSTKPGELHVAIKADRIYAITFVDDPNWMQKERNLKAWLSAYLIRSNEYEAGLSNGTCNIKKCWNVGFNCKGNGCGTFGRIGEDPKLLESYGNIPSCPGNFR